MGEGFLYTVRRKGKDPIVDDDPWLMIRGLSPLAPRFSPPISTYKDIQGSLPLLDFFSSSSQNQSTKDQSISQRKKRAGLYFSCTTVSFCNFTLYFYYDSLIFYHLIDEKLPSFTTNYFLYDHIFTNYILNLILTEQTFFQKTKQKPTVKMVNQVVILSALGLAGTTMAAPAAMRAENQARAVLTDDATRVGPGPVIPTPNFPVPIPKIPDLTADVSGDLQTRKVGFEVIKSLINGLGIGGGTAGSNEALGNGEGEEAAAKLKRALDGYSDAEKRKVGFEVIKSLINGLGIGGGTAGSNEALDSGEEPAAKRDLDLETRKVGFEVVKSLINGLGIGGGTAGSNEALGNGEEETAEKLKRAIDVLDEHEKRKGKLLETGTELLKGLATGLGIGGGTAGTEEALDDGTEEPAAKIKRHIDIQRRKGKLLETGVELLKGLATGIGIGGGTAGTEEALDDGSGGEEPAPEPAAKLKRELDMHEKRKGKLLETGVELLKGLATGIGIGGGTAGTEEALDDGTAEETAQKLKRAIDIIDDHEKRKGKLLETGTELLKGLATGLGIGGGTAGTEEALDDGSGEEPAAKIKRHIDVQKRKGKLLETGVELLKGLATGIGIGGGTAGTEEVVDDGSGEQPAAKLKRAVDIERRKGKLLETGVELLKGLATGIGIGGGTAGTEEALDDGSGEDPAAADPAAEQAKRIVLPPGGLPGGLPGGIPGGIPTPIPTIPDNLYVTLADTQE